MANRTIPELMSIDEVTDSLLFPVDNTIATYKASALKIFNYIVGKAAFAPAFAGVPVGVVSPFTGFVAPSGYLLCQGQAVSRTTYSELFSAITLPKAGALNSTINVTGLASTSDLGVGMPVSGTGIQAGTTIASIVSGTAITLSLAATATNAAANLIFAPYGVGDGTTTFNVPDLRGIFISGSGSQTVLGVTYNRVHGVKQRDQFQSHRHTQDPHTHAVASTNGASPVRIESGTGFASWNNGRVGYYVTDATGTNILQSSQPNIHAPSVDGSNGTPRVGSQTHPANLPMNHIIRTGVA